MKQTKKDLCGVELVENSIIINDRIQYYCTQGVQTDQVAFINFKYPEFWNSYQPNLKGRISLLINLGPYRFLISQSPANLSKLFEFLDQSAVSISDQKNIKDRISWSFQKFNDSSKETYADWIDQGPIYSQADFNFMLTWLVHDLWVFPTEHNAMRPINKQLKKEEYSDFTSNDLQIWKLKIQIVNQQYRNNFKVKTTGAGKAEKFHLLFNSIESSNNGLGRSYNWRIDSTSKINLGLSNHLLSNTIYTYHGYCGCKKEFRKDRPKLPKNYWYSSTKAQLSAAFLIEKANQTNDRMIWQTKINFINAEYHLKFELNQINNKKDYLIFNRKLYSDYLILNRKLYPDGVNLVNDRNFDIPSKIGEEYPIFNIYTGKVSGKLPTLYHYSIPERPSNPIRSKIQQLINF